MKLPVLIAPYLSVMLYRYDKSVDKFINDMLDREPLIADVDEHFVTLLIDGTYISIWIANRWYAYATRGTDSSASKGALHILGVNLWTEKRPRRKTMIRLHNYITANSTASMQDRELQFSTLIGEGTDNGK